VSSSVATECGMWRKVTGGALALAGLMWLSGMSGAAVVEQIALPVRQWVAVPMAEIGHGPAGDMKHVTAALNPSDGRIYMTGGDYAGQRFQQSYRQETWSLLLTERLASGASRNTGWRLEYPYCGPLDAVQPKHPDFVGWLWDAKRSVFWLVPGSMVESNDVCEGETTKAGDDPRFLINHLMTFDPATRRWSDLGRNVGPDVSDSWMSVLDPGRDEIIRFGFNGGSGAVVNVLRLADMTWQRIGLGTNAVGKDVRLNKEYLAADYVRRVIYAIDGISGRLHRYSMDARRLEDLGPVPGGPIGIENYTFIVWDSTNEVLLWYRESPGTFHAYEPTAKHWETLSLASNVTGVAARGRTLVYDPGQNVTILFGGVQPANLHMFLYRYSDGAKARGRKS
jgi:hypothetical protein